MGWKKIFISCAFLFLLSMTVYASGMNETISVVFGKISVTLDGFPLYFWSAEEGKQEPFIYDGSVYVPLERLASAQGKQYKWNPDTMTATIGVTEKAREYHEKMKEISYYSGIVPICPSNDSDNCCYVTGDIIYFFTAPGAKELTEDIEGHWGFPFYPTEIWTYNTETKSIRRILAGFQPSIINTVEANGNVIFTEKRSVGNQHFDLRTLQYDAKKNEVTVLDFQHGQITGDMREEVKAQLAIIYDRTFLTRHATASDILLAVDSWYSYCINENNLYVASKPKPNTNHSGFIYEIGRYDLSIKAYTPLLYRDADITQHDNNKVEIFVTESNEIEFYDNNTRYSLSSPNPNNIKELRHWRPCTSDGVS